MFELLWNNQLFRLFSISIGIQWVGAAAAILLKTEKFYDLTGSLTFILISHLSYENSVLSTRQTVQSWLVLGWACRLGSYLFIRVMKDGHDKRFNQAKEEPARMFIFWTLQGLWVFVTLLPTLMLNSERRNPPVGTRDYVGWGIWGFGFIFEVVADMQKSSFRSNPANKGKFIESGVWSLSRHPNYFGEIALWFGLYVSASSVFSRWQFLSVMSPMAVMLLITKVSGIPLLEKAGMKKWGEDPAYLRYLANTPSLVPRLSNLWSN